MKQKTSQVDFKSVGFKQFALNPVCAIIWIFSLILVFFGDPVVEIVSMVRPPDELTRVISPFALGYEATSNFPALSYTYFLIMQPTSLILFCFAWWSHAKNLDYRDVGQLYEKRGLIGRLLSAAFVVAVLLLQPICYYFVGGQEMPGARMNTSLVSMALLGPIVASGLFVFVSLLCVNIIRHYFEIQFTRRK